LQGSPWTRRGGYVEALAWTVARLAEAGVQALVPPRQLRAWERAFLMHLVTDAGPLYFRAAPEQCAHEPRLMEWLAQHFPGDVPDIVAAEHDRGWYVQRIRPEGGLLLEQVREEEEWYRAIRRFSDMQHHAVASARELHELGLPYRGLDVLAYRIPVLCAAAATPAEAGGAGLGAAEADRLQTLVPTLLSLCRELASYDVPDTIEHGNLGAGCVLGTLAGPVFLDWTDCSIAHPFFSPATLMADAAALLPASSHESRRRLRDSYLAAWSRYGSHDDLCRAFDIARILAPLHSAAMLHADVRPVAGYGWELAGLIPERLRAVLRLLLEPDAGVAAP
jgi:hypothetical protein